MGAESPRWSCARCKVSAGRIDGRPSALPESWTRSEESVFCLGCSRALAGETAVESAPSDCSSDDLIRLRRGAVIAFEIDRRPEATDRVIAQTCRTSGSAVGRVRDALAHVSEASAPTAPGG